MAILRKAFAALLLTVSIASAQGLGRLPGVISALDRGAKEAATIQSILDNSSTNKITILLDGGTWNINTNLTIPERATLVLLRNAILDIETNMVFTLEGNFVAGQHVCFTGFGTAGGAVQGVGKFPFRIPEWGSTSRFAIGTGYIQSYVTNRNDLSLTNQSLRWVDGTTISLADLNVRNTLTASNAVVSNSLTVYGGASVSGNVFVASNIVVGGNLTVTGSTTIAGTLTSTNPGFYTSIASNTATTVASNAPLFGFRAYTPTNIVTNAANTFIPVSNFAHEVYDTHSFFATNVFTPLIPGYWQINGSAYLRTAEANDEDAWAALVLVKNSATNPLILNGTNSSVLGSVASGGRKGWMVSGAETFYANGTDDYFRVYVFGRTASTNYGSSFSAQYLGR